MLLLNLLWRSAELRRQMSELIAVTLFVVSWTPSQVISPLDGILDLLS